MKDKNFKKRIKEIDDVFEKYGQGDILGWLESLEKRVRKLERQTK